MNPRNEDTEGCPLRSVQNYSIYVFKDVSYILVGLGSRYYY